MRGGFYCQDNELTTLEGAPEIVSIMFYEMDKMPSLNGAYVEANFYCAENKLTSLEYVPAGFNRLVSVFGSFSSLDEVPDALAPQTRARAATTLSAPVNVTKPIHFKVWG